MNNKINYWDRISDYYDWEFRLICTRQKHDLEFWLRQVEKYGDPVLEIACGSGRITIPVAKAGYRITALDNSPKMLEKLSDSASGLTNLKVTCQSMQDFSLPERYKFCFISYSSFQQLLSKQDQEACLRTIASHLSDGGILGLDIGTCICEGPDHMPLTRLYSEYIEEKNEKITMYTSHHIDRLNLIKYWEDHYRIETGTGVKKTIINRLALKECPRDYMELLLPACGFRILDLWGSFLEEQPQPDSHNLLYLAQKVS